MKRSNPKKKQPNGAPARVARTSQSRKNSASEADHDSAAVADDANLTAEFGPQFVPDHRGVPRLNQTRVGVGFARIARIKFDPIAGQFRQYVAKTGLWPVLDKHLARAQLGLFIKKLADEHQYPHILSQRTAGLLTAILNLVKGQEVFPPTQLNSGHPIAVKNGMLDLTGDAPKLLPFAPEYYCVHGLSVDYDPDARCPRFLTELMYPALTDAADRYLLQCFMGAVMMGCNDAQRFMVFHGAAASGKSTLANIIEDLVGRLRVASLRTSHLTSKFEAQAFIAKVLLAAKDVTGSFLAHEGAKLLKALIGDDEIEAELKYEGERVKLRGRLNVMIVSNSRLIVPLDNDFQAWKRRMLILEFQRDTPPSRIPQFADLLWSTEGEGILNFAIEGWMKHRRDLQEVGDYGLSDAQKKRIESVLMESMSVDAFVQSCIAHQSNGDVSGEELHLGYVDYCEKQGWTPVHARKFQMEVPNIMMKIHRVSKRGDIQRENGAVKGYKHVKLITPDSTAA